MLGLILIALVSTADAGGYHRHTNPSDHPLTPMVNPHEADPTICTTWVTPEWTAATYKWTVKNNTDADRRTSGHGVALALRYADGQTIDVVGRNGPQVALARGSRVANAYTVLQPTYTCYGVYDHQVAVDTKRFEGRMVIHAVELAPANTGVDIQQLGLTIHNASYYKSSKEVLNHSIIVTPIARHVVDFDELK